MTAAIAAPGLQSGVRFDPIWRRHALVLAGAWAALLLLFHRDAIDIVRIYWNSSTFSHCAFIPPIVGWLVWQRRHELAQLTPVGWWPGLIAIAGAAFLWLLGDAAGLAQARHLALVLMAQAMAVTVLGPNVVRGLMFPLAYLLFLVPFGDFLEWPLQLFTAQLVMPLLHLFGIPASIEGVLITTPNGWFEVAEACSGAKFVIAMIALATLVANVGYVSWRRRIAFMAMALIVPVFANGVRAFGTIYVAWWTSVETATGFDHIVYGWFFFAAVMAALLGVGWRFFDRKLHAPWFDPAALQARVKGQGDARFAALAALTIACGFVGWSAAIAGRAQPLPARIELPAVAGWQRVDMNPATFWSPNYPGADHYLLGRYADAAGRHVDLGIVVYGSQRDGKELISYGQGPTRDHGRWIKVDDIAPLAGGKGVRITAPGAGERDVVTWYRVGELSTSSDRAVKIETLKRKLLGGPQRAVAVLLSAEREGQDARDAMTRFLAALGPIDVVADQASGMR